MEPSEAEAKLKIIRDREIRRFAAIFNSLFWNKYQKPFLLLKRDNIEESYAYDLVLQHIQQCWDNHWSYYLYLQAQFEYARMPVLRQILCENSRIRFLKFLSVIKLQAEAKSGPIDTVGKLRKEFRKAHANALYYQQLRKDFSYEGRLEYVCRHADMFPGIYLIAYSEIVEYYCNNKRLPHDIELSRKSYLAIEEAIELLGNPEMDAAFCEEEDTLGRRLQV